MAQKIIFWLKREWSKKREVNYLYFSLLLLCIASLAIANFFFLNPPEAGFFILHAVGQAALEVGASLLAISVLKHFFPRWIHSLAVSFTFILVLIHFTDFTMIRLLDASISYLFKFFFGSGLNHIGAAFLALNMNALMIAISLGSLIAIPFLGIGLYRLTHYLASKRPLFLSFKQIGLGCAIVCLGLVIVEVATPMAKSRHAHEKYQKGLPFGATLISPPRQRISLPAPLAPPKEEGTVLAALPQGTLKQFPNIYFFVIETLRKDFVTAETAPHLTRFGRENIEIPHSFSNANSTYLSWFALFHSDFPYHWTTIRDRGTGGSIPLQFLKKQGYKIRVYSSADLRYFRMDEVLFGKNRALADQIEEYTLDPFLAPWKRDAMAIDSFARDLKSAEGREGNVYLFFLDSTHSEYSFPDTFPIQFQPIAEQIDYLTLSRDDIGPIQNRYRNAIAYVDSLMGRFFGLLNDHNAYDDAIVVITGDHSEEFLEEGALFHGTHLNQIQTNVPIFCKFQGKNRSVKTDTATHIDLFPSILDFLEPNVNWRLHFKGEPIFSPKTYPYRMTVLQNGANPPLEFSLETKTGQILARFFDVKNFYEQREIEILSISADEKKESLEETIESLFPQVFAPMLRDPQ